MEAILNIPGALLWFAQKLFTEVPFVVTGPLLLIWYVCLEAVAFQFWGRSLAGLVFEGLCHLARIPRRLGRALVHAHTHGISVPELPSWLKLSMYVDWVPAKESSVATTPPQPRLNPEFAFFEKALGIIQNLELNPYVTSKASERLIQVWARERHKRKLEDIPVLELKIQYGSAYIVVGGATVSILKLGEEADRDVAAAEFTKQLDNLRAH